MQCIVFLLLFCLMGQSETPPVRKQRFDFSGYFIPQASQPNISSVRWFFINNSESVNSKNKKRIELRIGNEKRWKTYHPLIVRIISNQLTYKTKAHKGMQYDFSGSFTPNDYEKELGNFDDNSSQKSIKLRGTLRTFQNEKLIRSEVLLFYYTIGA